MRIGNTLVCEIIYSTILKRYQTKEGAEEVAKSMAGFRQAASESKPGVFT
jgi:hypothetical protein